MELALERGNSKRLHDGLRFTGGQCLARGSTVKPAETAGGTSRWIDGPTLQEDHAGAVRDPAASPKNRAECVIGTDEIAERASLAAKCLPVVDNLSRVLGVRYRWAAERLTQQQSRGDGIVARPRQGASSSMCRRSTLV